MTDRTTLLALTERVEGLEGPDREVDAEIAVTLDGRGSVASCSPAYLYAVGNSFADIGTFSDIPAYTASLDAAMTLVPEGWRLHCLGQDPNGVWIAHMTRSQKAPYTGESARSGSPALALTAASLRALAQQEPAHDAG